MFVLVFWRFFPTCLARVITAKVPVFFVPAAPLLVLRWLDLQAYTLWCIGCASLFHLFLVVGNGSHGGCTVSL